MARIAKWACVFKLPIIREDINPRIAKIDPKAPFGAFTRIFREEHCRQLDPFGNGSCPYRREDCALAYYVVAQKALAARTSRIGLFRTLARAYGAERADNKPLARDTIRTDGQGSSQTGRVGSGDAEGQGLRTSRPRSIGDLFGDDDV
jgi:hypothetical protein